MGFSIAAPCYNEGPRLKRFILSSLAIRGVEEIFIVDHRSDDNSLDILKELQDVCKSRGVALKWITETRDFCREFTMADLRQVVVKGCSNKIVHMLDADMVLGPSYSIWHVHAKEFLMLKMMCIVLAMKFRVCKNL